MCTDRLFYNHSLFITADTARITGQPPLDGPGPGRFSQGTF